MKGGSVRRITHGLHVGDTAVKSNVVEVPGDLITYHVENLYILGSSV